MANENGEWIMYGTSDSDPGCIRSAGELTDFVRETGFLPLFKNSVPGFSVEEKTVARYWWTDHERDPWMWRQIIASSGDVAYGKFFDKKAGFISLDWLPYFCNWRRDGYDFDARWDDEKASFRQKKIMDCFNDTDSLFSFELKQLAGFGKGGEKNFEGTVTCLEMQTYLTISAFTQRRNKHGRPYGWNIAVLSPPEKVWGRELVSKAYGESPEGSRKKIYAHVKKLYPDASEGQILSILRF